jgi:flavin reductase (DIM6/NTAB) family NADH-FMN oxidoreductase RutF
MAAELVGPFPDGVDPGEYDKLRRRALWRMPSGLYLLGSAAGGRQNLMTHNLAVQVATNPKLLGAAVRRDALTHRLIEEGGVFSLSFLKREDRAVVRGFTKPATPGPGPGMLGGLRVRTGRTGSPIPELAVAWLECEVRERLYLGDHTFFVGEVVDCGAPDEEAPVLRMEDTRLNYGG